MIPPFTAHQNQISDCVRMSSPGFTKSRGPPEVVATTGLPEAQASPTGCTRAQTGEGGEKGGRVGRGTGGGGEEYSRGGGGRNTPKILHPAPTVGALMIRIGFWGLLYYNYKKEPPKIV